MRWRTTPSSPPPRRRGPDPTQWSLTPARSPAPAPLAKQMSASFHHLLQARPSLGDKGTGASETGRDWSRQKRARPPSIASVRLASPSGSEHTVIASSATVASAAAITSEVTASVAAARAAAATAISPRSHRHAAVGDRCPQCLSHGGAHRPATRECDGADSTGGRDYADLAYRGRLVRLAFSRAGAIAPSC